VCYRIYYQFTGIRQRYQLGLDQWHDNVALSLVSVWHWNENILGCFKENLAAATIAFVRPFVVSSMALFDVHSCLENYKNHLPVLGQLVTSTTKATSVMIRWIAPQLEAHEQVIDSAIGALRDGIVERI